MADIGALLELQGNRATLEHLLRILAKRAVVPFVGAGMTVESGYPAWGPFLKDLVAGTAGAVKIDELVDDGKYEQATDGIISMQGRDGLNVSIDTTFAPHGQPTGAITQLPLLASGPVVTTNFDRVLEDVWGRGEAFAHVYTGQQAGKITEKFREDSRARILIKLHGDVGDSIHRILSPRDYGQYYTEDGSISSDKPLTQVLDYIATTFSLLFVGCSLRGDRTMSVLREVQQRRAQVPHFAIVECPADPERRQERFKDLTSHGIRPIWYPEGDHDSVKSIFEYLVQRQGEKRKWERAAVVGIYVLMLALMLVVTPIGLMVPGGEEKKELVAGIYLHKPEWEPDEAKVAFEKLFTAFNDLRPERKRGDYRIATEVRMFKARKEAIDALRSKQIDILGELSLPELREICRDTGAIPFISPGYDRSGVYNAVFVMSRTEVDKAIERAADSKSARDNWMGDESLGDDSIKPRLWQYAIRRARDPGGSKWFRLMDSGSASGYWYPAQLIWKELESENVPLEDVAKPGESEPNDLLDDIAEGKYIAGAVAEFRLKAWQKLHAPAVGTSEGDAAASSPGDLVVVHRMPMIPNGAFVLRRALADNERLLRTLQECWEIAGRRAFRALSSVSTVNYDVYLPPLWNPVTLDHYASSFEILTTDPWVRHKLAVRRKFLVLGGFLLASVALLVILMVRRRRAQ